MGQQEVQCYEVVTDTHSNYVHDQQVFAMLPIAICFFEVDPGYIMQLDLSHGLLTPSLPSKFVEVVRLSMNPKQLKLTAAC